MDTAVDEIGFSSLQVGGTEGDREFEERFLECFGLGDEEEKDSQRSDVHRTDSEPTAEEREKQLKGQKVNSPW